MKKRIKIKNSISSHFKSTSVFVAIFMMFLISFIADMLARGVQTVFQKYSPTSWRYEYTSVVPDYYNEKSHFSEGEILRFNSIVERHRDIDMVRQDKAYCIEDGSLVKYPTQLRPETGTEFIERGHKDSSRKYYVKIDEIAEICKMCGTSIGVTSLGYRKIWTYCIDWFAVNK